MFIYGVSLGDSTTYTIKLKEYVNSHDVFLAPMILTVISIAFTFVMMIPYLKKFRRYLLFVVSIE